MCSSANNHCILLSIATLLQHIMWKPELLQIFAIQYEVAMATYYWCSSYEFRHQIANRWWGNRKLRVPGLERQALTVLAPRKIWLAITLPKMICSVHEMHTSCFMRLTEFRNLNETNLYPRAWSMWFVLNGPFILKHLF